MKKAIALLLSVVMIFSSFGAVSVFALEETEAKAIAYDYNEQKEDYSDLFFFPATRKSTTVLIDKLNIKVSDLLKQMELEKTVYSDEFVTTLAKLTDSLLGSDKGFAGFQHEITAENFPEAAAFIEAAKEEKKTWDEIDAIPFGIEPGDKVKFVKAVGAATANLGTTLNFAIFMGTWLGADVHDPIVELVESLHVGEATTISALAENQQGNETMEYVAEVIIKVVDRLVANPVNYIIEILPDFLGAYDNFGAAVAKFGDTGMGVSINLPALEGIIYDLASGLGIELPEMDLSVIEGMATAAAVKSGIFGGYRVRLDGDKPVIFTTIYYYVVKVLENEYNKTQVESIIAEKTGDPEAGEEITEATDIESTVKSICETIDKVIEVMDTPIPSIIAIIAKFAILRTIAEFFRMMVERISAMF